jgi:hypothetical protein
VARTSSQFDPLAEWQECRTTIARFDGFLSTTRQYGFTLVTVLLTANALITVGDTAVDRPAASIVVMALLLALFMLDNYYWDLLKAAVKRATKLEHDADAGISGELSASSDRSHLSDVILGVYAVFVLVAAFVGVTGVWEARPQDIGGYVVLFAATAIEIVAMLVIYDIVQQPKRPTRFWGSVDRAVKTMVPDLAPPHSEEAAGIGSKPNRVLKN